MNINQLFADAVALQNEGRWSDAAQLYRKIDKARPGTPAVKWNLGVVLKAQERWSDALAAVARAAGGQVLPYDPAERVAPLGEPGPAVLPAEEGM